MRRGVRRISPIRVSASVGAASGSGVGISGSLPPMSNLVPSSNGNGHHPIVAEASGDVPFKVGTRERVYLDAVLKLLGEGGRLTNALIAAAMRPPSSEDAIRKWRTRHPEVDRWVDEQCRLEAEHSKGRIIMRATQLALRGSIDHMKYCAQIGGWFADGGSGEPGVPQTVFNVNLLVPRP